MGIPPQAAALGAAALRDPSTAKTYIRNPKAALSGAAESHAPAAADRGVASAKRLATAPLKAWEAVPRMVVRGLQFVLGLVAAGVYGNRLASGDRSAEWVWGVLVAGSACLAALLLAVAAPLGALTGWRRAQAHRAWALDAGLAVCWLVAFGVFAGIFLHRGDDGGDDGGADDDTYKGASTGVMKGAVWVDLVECILWTLSAAYGAAKTFLGDKVDGLGGRVVDKVLRRRRDRKQAAQKEFEMGEAV